jgi:hypothetical protein
MRMDAPESLDDASAFHAALRGAWGALRWDTEADA